MDAIIKSIKSYVREKSEEYRLSSEDGYDFWNEHIKLVCEEAERLAKEFGAEVEIVSLGALLHDIALVARASSKENHHIKGAELTKQILSQYDLDDSKKARIIGCVLHHRSSKNAENIEELCVADADILAHFDNPIMLISAAHSRGIHNTAKVRQFLKETYEKDFNDLSERTKGSFAQRYKTIIQIVCGR